MASTKEQQLATLHKCITDACTKTLSTMGKDEINSFILAPYRELERELLSS